MDRATAAYLGEQLGLGLIQPEELTQPEVEVVMWLKKVEPERVPAEVLARISRSDHRA